MFFFVVFFFYTYARYGMALALMSLAVIVGSLAGATAPFNGIRWAAPIIVVLVAAYVLFVLPESLLLKNRLPFREVWCYRVFLFAC